MVYADHSMGEGQKYQGEQIQRSEQFVPPKWHHRGGRDREVLSDQNGYLFKSISSICTDTIVCWPLTLKRGLWVSDHRGHVCHPLSRPPAYLAHTNPINLPILSWHRKYQHTWPPSWVLSDILRKKHCLLLNPIQTKKNLSNLSF